MFYYLDGTLTEREPGLAVVDCGGVGYSLTVSLTTSDTLSAKVGSRVKLYTYLQVREDGVELFGFRDKDELDCFKLLIGHFSFDNIRNSGADNRLFIFF